MQRFSSILPSAVFCAILASQSDFVPLWDAWVYAECAARAALAPTELHSFSCAGHLSHAYMALLALPTFFDKAQQMWHLLLVNATLGCVAIHSTISIGARMLPDRAYEWDVALVGLLVGVHPQLLASAVFINVDFGVYAFGMATLAALLQRRYVSAAVAGSLLVFSKETGIAVYAFFVASYLWLRSGRTGLVPKIPKSHAWRLSALIIPGLALLTAYCLFPDERSSWLKSVTAREWVNALTSFDWREPRERALWAALFVMQFGWVMCSTVAIALGFWLVRLTAGKATRPLRGIDSGAVVTVTVATLLCTIVLTRPQTYVNTRYFGILYALFSLVFLVALAHFVESSLLRRVLLAGCVVLFALSSFRTIDPVSKRLYGTFEFGAHQMLRMTAVSKECCGSGVDQLAYNLEFVHFHQLLNAAMRDFKPTDARPVVVADQMAWNLADSLDTASFARTMPKLQGPSRTLADLFGWSRVLQRRPREILFLALPNADNRSAQAELMRWYNVAVPRRYERSGYEIRGLWLSRR